MSQSLDHIPGSPRDRIFAALFEESLKKRSDMRAARSSPPKSCASTATTWWSTPASRARPTFPIEEFKNDQGEVEVQVGDFVAVAIDAIENGYGDTILSRDKAKRLASWMSSRSARVRRLRQPARSPARSRAA